MTATTIVERTEHITATSDVLVPLLADLRRWVEWSPWEGVDPALQRQYAGQPGTVGSSYTWKGNRKAGAGRMTVDHVAADLVGISLDFTRPFRSSNTIRFTLTSEGTATQVTWTMESPKTFFTRFMNLDKMVGGDFATGLRQLKDVAEAL